MSAQPADLVTSPRAHPPRRSLRSRQGEAGVIVEQGEGSPSVIVACGNDVTVKNGIALCKSKRCLTCPKLIQSKYFTSNITNRRYEIINPTHEIITCKSQNLVYLLTCENCNIQYVGETTSALHMRMNVHRTSKSGCEHFIEHFSNVCTNKSFSIQVIEKLSGNGYDEIGDVSSEMTDKRLEREDFWMKKLRTIYPYGLNEKAKKKKSKTVDNGSIGNLFPPLPRTGERPSSSRNNRNNHFSAITKDEFFVQFDMAIQNNIKTSMNLIRKIIDKVKKKALKEIVFSIIDNHWNENEKYKQWYSFVVDIIDTKLYKGIEIKEKKAPKNLCILTFVNKGLEHINMTKILKSPDVVRHLPECLQNEDERPIISYKLKAPIRNKLLNYKETVTSIRDDKPIEEYPCPCAHSTFCNPDHGHVITGDLGIIENSKLRSLFTKGPNYREPMNISYGKCLTEIENAMTIYVQKLIADNNLLPDSMNPWKNEILNKVKGKINILKRKRVPRRKPLLQDPIIKAYLEILHSNYVIVPIDKAANNFAFICKRFYVTQLLAEVGILNNNSQTYEHLDKDYHQIINENIELCKRYGLEVGDREQCLPIMYWIPKMHKNPVDSRFIVASAKCSTKPLSKAVSTVFKLIFKQIQNFHDKSTFYSRYNKFWVIENSSPVINKLDKINVKKRAKEISTFDFKTLYTKIDHDNLLHRLYGIIDFSFKGGSRRFIAFNDNCAYWAKNKSGKRYFTKNSLKAIVKHLIVNCHFQIGNILLCQSIGIPMGIDPAPFWANLYLYSYECEYMNELIKRNKSKAFCYHGSFRFIDDKCCINGSREFANTFPNIYPPSLELKLEHQGDHATFLDLDITIVDDIFVYKLFDKRDDFPFSIVRMPYLSSDIPSYIFYGTILSEFLRISRCTLLFEDFVSKTRALYYRMINQGGNKVKIKQQIRKVIQRHPIPFSKYRKTTQEIIDSITQAD